MREKIIEIWLWTMAIAFTLLGICSAVAVVAMMTLSVMRWIQ